MITQDISLFEQVDLIIENADNANYKLLIASLEKGIDIARLQYESEEAIMSFFNYSGLAEHIADHVRLRQVFTETQAIILSGTLPQGNVIQLVAELRQTLLAHQTHFDDLYTNTRL